jgi:predicted nucleic acid-binding protein
MDAFDADALIYASQTGHVTGRRVLRLFDEPADSVPIVGVGSVLLMPETLTKPTRLDLAPQRVALLGLLGRLELLPVTAAIARYAVELGVEYGFKTVDAVHLATALDVGADRFITNNARDFPKTIDGIAITYPDDLPRDGSAVR